MKYESQTVTLGPEDRLVRTDSGKVLRVPDNWELLPPGDAGLTRRVKSSGPTWTVQEKKGRRVFSKGVWADKSLIEKIRAEIEAERATESYAKRMTAAATRRGVKQAKYVEDFVGAVESFLNFDSRYEELAKRMAKAIAEHATPVGSGTVARTERIPIERRAEAATIAWMRHQTTSYDNLKIERVRGRRREVRRMLAEQSRGVLECYRRGLAVASDRCPLQIAFGAT